MMEQGPYLSIRTGIVTTSVTGDNTRTLPLYSFCDFRSHFKHPKLNKWRNGIIAVSDKTKTRSDQDTNVSSCHQHKKQYERRVHCRSRTTSNPTFLAHWLSVVVTLNLVHSVHHPQQQHLCFQHHGEVLSLNSLLHHL